MSIRKLTKVMILSMVLFLLCTLYGEVKAGDPIGGDIIIYQGEHDQFSPSAAFDSQINSYLVVWSNDRPGNDDIYAQRISSLGNPLGSWFPIAAGAGFERRSPDVAFNDARQEFLVVWEEEPHGGYLSIRGLRVSNFGEPIPPVIEISRGPALKNCHKPSVAYASTSDSYLVVWESMVSGGIHSTIEAQVVTSEGGLQGSNFAISEAISSIGFSDSTPDLAYNRSHNEFLSVFERIFDTMPDHSIYGRRITGSGSLIGPSAEVISATSQDQLNPAVSGIPTIPGEGKYFVAWEAQYSPGNINIYGKRFQHDLSGDGIILMLSISPGNDSNPAIAADEFSDQFLVSWSQPWGPSANSLISARYVSQENDVLESEMVIGGNQAGLFSDMPALASGLPGDFLVVFIDTLSGSLDSDIFGQLVGIRQYLPLTIR